MLDIQKNKLKRGCKNALHGIPDDRLCCYEKQHSVSAHGAQADRLGAAKQLRAHARYRKTAIVQFSEM